MFSHNKRLQYTVRVNESNPGLANLMLEQFGGPQGELAAAMRYFTQASRRGRSGPQGHAARHRHRGAQPPRGDRHHRRHAQQGREGPARRGRWTEARAVPRHHRRRQRPHLTQVLYGGGPALTNSAGVPWTAAYVDTIGEPTGDLRSNIAAEARAKIIYERLINCTDDPGVKEALGFPDDARDRAPEVVREGAVRDRSRTSRPASCPAMPQFTNVYFNMSVGEGDQRGPWNKEPGFEYREAQVAVDGGDGSASVRIRPDDMQLLKQAATRQQSDPESDPVTGAMLGKEDGHGAGFRQIR